MVETRTAKLETLKDKIIVVRVNQRATQSLQDARQNIEASVDLARNKKTALMVDIRFCQPLEAEVRHFYSGADLFQSFTAFGLLVDASPLGIMMGNIYFKVARLSVPSKLFTDETDCVNWLLGKTK